MYTSLGIQTTHIQAPHPGAAHSKYPLHLRVSPPQELPSEEQEYSDDEAEPTISHAYKPHILVQRTGLVHVSPSRILVRHTETDFRVSQELPSEGHESSDDEAKTGVYPIITDHTYRCCIQTPHSGAAHKKRISTYGYPPSQELPSEEQEYSDDEAGPTYFP
jgi:hypothetical protein